MIKIFTLLLLLLASPAWAALSRETATVHDQNANADPWTFNATVPSGANFAVLICQSSTTSGDVFGTATYNSVSMSSEVVENNTSGTVTEMWSLANPSVGTFQVSVDLTVSQDGGCVFIPYSGADVSGDPFTGVTSAQGQATSTTLNVTCATGNEVVSGGGTASLRVIETDVSQTELANIDDGTGTTWASAEAGAASVAMDYNFCVVAGYPPCTASSQHFSHVGGCVVAAVASTRRIAPIFFQ